MNWAAFLLVIGLGSFLGSLVVTGIRHDDGKSIKISVSVIMLSIVIIAIAVGMGTA